VRQRHRSVANWRASATTVFFFKAAAVVTQGGTMADGSAGTGVGQICVTVNLQLCPNAYMKTQRIIGALWMLFNGVLGILYLWLLLYPIIRFSRVPSSPGFCFGALFCLLYWAGAAAGFSLFRGAQGARKFVALVAVLIVMATITGMFALRSLPRMYYIASVFATVSAGFLFLPRHNTVA